MTYRDSQARLADRTARQLISLYAKLQEGQIDQDQFFYLAVPALETACYAAAQLADAELAKRLDAEPVGVDLDVTDALGKALTTMLADPEPVSALDRLARWRVFGTAQETWAQLLSEHPGVKGWAREATADACERCQKYVGVVRGLDEPMFHHPGCQCIQGPVPA